MIEELFDKSERNLDELTKKMRATPQLLASLEQDACQPRFAMKADVPTYIKTHKRA